MATQGGRPAIFAARAAPLQVSYLGYPGSMGAPFIDYLIADEVVAPPAHQQYFDEKVVYLPHSYQANARRAVAPAKPTRAEVGLPAHGVVLCCFNQSYKFGPETFAIWMRLLEATDGAVLWLLDPGARAADNLRRAAQANGVAPERVIFAPLSPPPGHLARHVCADMFVDTWPVNAHTTASDALWMGVPVVTLAHTSFAGRVAASVLRAAGLPELIAATPDAYERIARELAADPARLAALKARLIATRDLSPLFDAGGHAHHLEAAYSAMHARRTAGLAPEHIVISL